MIVRMLSENLGEIGTRICEEHEWPPREPYEAKGI